MLMPFNPKSFRVFAECSRIVKQSGMVLKKSDDEFVEGDLLKSIVESIITSNIIIANLDGKNPNVFYELGIAHTLGKKTILITGYRPEELPFDIKNKYIIFYQSFEELEKKLGNAVNDLLKISRED